MISGWHLKNYKSFDEVSMELRPLTIFVGPNNSGKSSLISPLRILIQTIESFDSELPLVLNGTLGDFGTYKDVVFQNTRRRDIEISLDFYNKSINFTNPDRKDLIKVDLKFSYRGVRREIILKGIKITDSKEILLETRYSNTTGKQLVHKFANITIPKQVSSSFSKGLRIYNFIPHFTPLYLFEMKNKKSIPNSFLKNLTDSELSNAARKIIRTGNSLHRMILDMDYIGPMRVPPERTILFTGEKRSRIGAHGENASNILAMDSIRRGKEKRGIKQEIVDWLQKAGIAGDININLLSDRHYEIKIQNEQTKEYQNYADVGYGNSQVIPILVGGFNMAKNSTYIMEEPEIHLHPKAQAELGDFLIRLHKKQVQAIVETHSEHMILRLQQHVASKKISNGDVIFYYVCGTESGKTITKLEMDSQGRFVDEWPGGFFPQRLNEAKKLAKLRY